MALNRQGREFIRDTAEKPEGGGEDATGRNTPSTGGVALPTDPLPGYNGGTQGSVAIRGASGWKVLGPASVSGYVLTSRGEGEDAEWSGKALGITSRFSFALASASPTITLATSVVTISA